jgi:uncharacterized membrane protein YccC
VAFIGFAVTAVAVPVQVYDITGSSFWVGLLGAVGSRRRSRTGVTGPRRAS